MRKLSLTLLLFLLFLSSLALFVAGPTSAQEPPPKGREALPAGPTPAAPGLSSLDRPTLAKIEPQLLKKLLQAQGQPAPFIVYLNSQADPVAAVNALTSTLGALAAADPVVRRTAVINALQNTAGSSQAGVLQLLAGSPAAAEVRPLWIVNAVAARGTLDLALQLARQPEVKIIRLDKTISLGHSPALPSARGEPAPTPGWNIARIRANLVHTIFGVNGTGVVVGSIDTGVDWQHPALQAAYRGYTGPGKLPLHPGNWFDATGQGAAYPVDGYGHGTHTVGTMVGANGIGVAPGARWIAARAFDGGGVALNSWLHAAFQWMLAPGGDPALAPDIVNNSWGSDNGASTEFEADVQALRSAGIFPVFSAGNNGPDSGTVGSPGSLAPAFSVGATDQVDEITLFSSRGPSPWGQTKPEVSAPGKDIISSLPGGAYGSLNGTSMAAPHVSGLAALLLQASPGLRGNLAGISTAITSTAVRLGSPVPNNTYGWGRIEAYNAVAAVANSGTLQGKLTAGENGLPVRGGTVLITPRAGGVSISTGSNDGGDYIQGLAPNTYNVTASAFGYEPVTVLNVQVLSRKATVLNFELPSRPAGVLQGAVRDSVTGRPLTATIVVEGTPARASSNLANGSYSLPLPIGSYTVTVTAARHRQARFNVSIEAGLATVLDAWLEPGPAILLVDSGKWYNESQAGAYQQALADLLYPYDTWQIRQPFAAPADVPGADVLAAYDIVIWSSPYDSPGYVGAEAALMDFLDAGGKLLLSGQDVAYFDGAGSLLPVIPYLRQYLKTEFEADDSGLDTVSGVPGGPFDGLALTISGGDGADNQELPDAVTVTDPDVAGPLATYDGLQLAGVHVGQCLPYRAIYLAFGFEAISTRAGRSQVMGRALDWLKQAPPPADIRLSPAEETRVGNFGAPVSHTVRIFNSGVMTDVYQFSLAPGKWPVSPSSPPPIQVPACQARTLTLTVRVDPNVDWHTFDTFTLTAQSQQDPGLAAAVTRTTKSPAPVLLVDDDRWYSFANSYTQALQTNNLLYDYWYVPKSWNGPLPPSPPLETLQMYPMTVWYTGYDWFQPLTAVEEQRLAAYLDGGGRLWFSSQDYIYNLPGNLPSPFARDYLGVLSHTEDYSSTLMLGEAGNPVGTHLGPEPFTFPPFYNNWTDALTPTASAGVASRGQAGQANGLTQAGLGPGGRAWRTTFLAFGPELLNPAAHARLAQRSLGWLSWLGASTVTPHVSASLDDRPITYTAVIANDGWAGMTTAVFTATFPAGLSLQSFSPGLSPAGGDLVWQGPLAQNERRVFTYTALLAGSLPLGTIVSQASWLAYPEHHILFDRVADVYVNFPSLEGSTMSVTPGQGVGEGDVLAYTITLRNNGLVGAPVVTVTDTLPPLLQLLAVGSPSQGQVVSSGRTITWTTSLAKDELATLVFQAVVNDRVGTVIDNVAYASSGFGPPVPLAARATFKVGPVYFPLLMKNSP